MPDTNKKGAPAEAPETTSCCSDSTSNQGNTITILETVGPCLTKVYKANGVSEDFGDAASFRVHEELIRDLKHFAEYHQEELRGSKRLGIIRGKFVGTELGEKANVTGTYCRTNANFTDQPLHLFMIDIDGYRPGFADPIADTEQAVLDFFTDNLSPAFQDCSFYWHLSSSAGMPGKEGILKCHVWLWSKTPYTCAQLTEWAKSIGPAVDRAVYRRVQLHYVCDPIFEEGRIDPVPVRCGFHQGKTDYVDLVIDEASLAKARDQGSGEGGSDMVLKDPSEKEGLIGAFHKAFTAEDVLLHHLEGFDQVTERRYTWHDGGGTPEGVWVHDDGQHIGSSHNTWPIDGIANLWDVVRVFKFGDLDHQDGEEEDFETLGEFQVGSRPSDLAMKAWAAQLPELKEAVVEERATELERLRQLIADAQDNYDLENVAAPQIREAQLSPGEQALLTQAVLARYKALGLQMSKPDVTRMLRRRLVRDASAPNWVGDWVWVNAWNGFMNTRTKQEVSERSFNATYDRNMAPYADENGAIPKASYMALNQWGAPTVDSVRYAPGEAVTFEKDGIWYGNSFRADIMAPMPETFSKKDLEAIAIVDEHAAMLIPNEWERILFLDYLAYCVKFPGRKIRWAPVLKGVEGDGKSAFICLMELILGERNVRVLDSSTLEKSDFSGWRTGQCFTGIEEMKLHGHNRYDVFNKIKPDLANDRVEIHPKGKDPYTVPNTTNYLLLTNFDDGVPINDNDRRCMFLRSPFLTKEDLVAELQRRGFPTRSAYFDRLFDFALKQHAGALRKWLAERELHPDFRPDSTAPETSARDLAVDLSRRDDDDAVDAILEEGGLGIYPNLVSIRCLNAALKAAGDAGMRTRRAQSLLSARGYLPCPKTGKKNQRRWRGEVHAFYFRGALPGDPVAEAERLEKDRENKALEESFTD